MIATSEPMLSFLFREQFSSRESFEAALKVESLLFVLNTAPLSFLLTLIMAEGRPKFLLFTY
jgi:hypothetical protein